MADSEGRPWYREPETFIALAALIVSLSAVTVGIYEAWLQRAHDRAEVWPHVEISTFTTPTGASIYVENTGLGPAIINSVVVTVDGKPMTSWPATVAVLMGHAPTKYGTSTVVGHGLRAGDKVTMFDMSRSDIPTNFWEWIARVGVTVCYESAFHDHWSVSDTHLGGTSAWTVVTTCPAPAPGTDF